MRNEPGLKTARAVGRVMSNLAKLTPDARKRTFSQIFLKYCCFCAESGCGGKCDTPTPAPSDPVMAVLR